jgi:hypothetical protein
MQKVNDKKLEKYSLSEYPETESQISAIYDNIFDILRKLNLN